MNLAIFDFCDTLVNFQSANEFCKYVLRKESRKTYLWVDHFCEQYFIYRIATKFSLDSDAQKKFLLSGLKGLSKSKIESYGFDFVQDVIENHINKEVFERFLSHINRRDAVVINSGGYEPYIQYFSKKYNIELSFSTKFKFVNDIFTGNIEGADCLGYEKVSRMKQTDVLNKHYSDIFVYSDSVTDMPIFDLANHKIAIIKTKDVPKWCQSNFEIIKLG